MNTIYRCVFVWMWSVWIRCRVGVRTGGLRHGSCSVMTVMSDDVIPGEHQEAPACYICFNSRLLCAVCRAVVSCYHPCRQSFKSNWHSRPYVYVHACFFTCICDLILLTGQHSYIQINTEDVSTVLSSIHTGPFIKFNKTNTLAYKDLYVPVH